MTGNNIPLIIGDYMKCYKCEKEIGDGINNYIISSEDNNYYCEECIKLNHVQCDSCKKWFYKEHMNNVKGTNLDYCDNCYFNIYQYDNTIKSYHHRDIDIHFKKLDDETTQLFYGFELEVENDKRIIYNNKMATLIRNKYPHLELCFEYDSSLSNGFEIISQPMTKKYIDDHANDFKEILDLLVDNGFKSHDGGRCGLHVHVSKKGLGKCVRKNTNKILLFTETYKNEIKEFSRRKTFDFCNFISEVNKVYKNDNYYKSIKVLENEPAKKSRYCLINTNNRNTIEFRVFRGTLKYTTFKATLDFVDNLINVITKNPISRINWDKVIEYNETIELQTYLSDKMLFNSTFMVDETKNVDKAYNMNLHKLENVEKEFTGLLKNLYQDVNNYCNNIGINIDDINKSIELKCKLFEILKNATQLFHKKTDKSLRSILNLNLSSYNNSINNLSDSIILSLMDNGKCDDDFIEKIDKYKDKLSYNTTTERGEI